MAENGASYAFAMGSRSWRRSFFGLFALLFMASLVTTSLPSAQAAVVAFPGARPFNLYVPTSYTPGTPEPLVIALHGFGQSGTAFEQYLKITPLAQSRGFLYVAPNGTADPHGVRFWNATPECCDFQSPKVNDDAYLVGLINQISAQYTVDPARIYLVGHSNGGFMVNELACAHSDLFAAVVNIAGGNFGKMTQCKPSHPITYLQLWGTKDETYKENHIMGKYIAGAMANISFWAKRNGCSASIKSPAALDLDKKVSGNETDTYDYQNCASGVDVQFWKMNGVDHVPNISATFSASIIDFLLAHKNVNAL